MALIQVGATQKTVAPPDVVYGELFRDVQLARIFPDNKTFVDCTPKRDPATIVADYRRIKANPAIRFSLEMFVQENFHLPPTPATDYKSSAGDIAQHIKELWPVLKRGNDSVVKGSSLLPLPYPYIVPGGRFREIYYWDSYFTMLGLKESGEGDMIENMVRNFAYLINTYGHIPNGNRSYYLSRSQPPFFALMVRLLAGIKGDAVYTEMLPALQGEWNYWMDKTAPTKHVVRMPDGSLLNRYYDQLDKPRQESYAEDVATAKEGGNKPGIYRHLRSGAESGWDFSSRWFADGQNISTIQTTDIIPVDLNALLFALEETLATAYQQSGDAANAQRYAAAAAARKAAINKYCWSMAMGWYTDYNIATFRHTRTWTLAGLVPFFLNIAPNNHIYAAAQNTRMRFLKAGGLITTDKRTGQQWDAPNGWAPLQWMAIVGFENYGQPQLARTIASRWLQLNADVYKRTGKMMEKYNVMETGLEAGGGEYPSQDGFGWTNGVLMAIIAKYKGI
jgi:alpha,alpha-trehalase